MSELREPTLAILSSWNDYHSFARQVFILTNANLKARYRKTIAGFVWVVLNPIIMYGVQALVFKGFLNLQIPNYAVFLMTGLLPWIFATQSMDMCTGIFLNSSSLLKSFQVNPLVYLVAQLTDNAVNFLAAFSLLLIPLWFTHPTHAYALLLLPLPMITLVVGVFGICWLLAIAQVFFRDTKFLLQFVTSVGFFLTPIFYSVDFIPEKLRWIPWVNPFYRLLLPFRALLTEFELFGFAKAMGGALVCAALTVTLAAHFWKRKRNAIYFNV